MPAANYEEFRARRNFGSLDGIRCLSIAAVVWHHTVSGVDAWPATKRGFLGVDMFFVLSGFLIVTLLLRERERTGTISLAKFYARRSLRIFPIYYGLLAVLALVFGVFRRDGALAGPFFAELPYYLTYTANWVELHTLLSISWSLAAEEQFYLVWPPLEKLAGRFVIPVLLAVIAVNQLVNFRLLDGAILSWTGLRASDLPMLQATFTPICLGALLAHVLHARGGFGTASRAVSSSWASPAALAALVALASLPAADISGWQRLAIQACMAVLLSACVVREDHGLHGLLRFGPIARVGVISYGVYLYHLFARHAAESLLGPSLLEIPLALFAASLVFTIAIAELSYRYYETPFLRAKDWLHARDELRSRDARP